MYKKATQEQCSLKSLERLVTVFELVLKQRNDQIKIIFTIITTSIVHNDNYNYIAPASLF